MKQFSSFLEKHSYYGTLVARVGIAAVFLWFGIDKFVHVENWVGWVPGWMQALIPISMVSFMYVQGAIEALCGVLLFVGYQVRFASGLAVVTLLGIEFAMVGTGQTEMMLRDAGLLAASLSLFFTGSYCLSVDCYLCEGVATKPGKR